MESQIKEDLGIKEVHWEYRSECICELVKSGFMQVASNLHHLPFRATKESEKSKWKKMC